VESGGYRHHPQKITGIKERMRGTKFQEHFSQAQLFYNSLAPHEKRHLIAAISFELDHCEDPVVYKSAIPRLADIDLDLATQVAQNLGVTPPTNPARANHGRKARGLSMTEFLPATPSIKSRRIAILVADGFDISVVEGIKAVLSACGALPFVIGPRRGEIFPEGVERGTEGKGIVADHHFEGMRSTMFDALFIPSGADSARTLATNGRAIHWVLEAFGHLKAIGACGEGVAFLREIVRLPGIEFCSSSVESLKVSYGVVTAGKFGAPSSITEGLKLLKGATNFSEAFVYEVSQHRNWEREEQGLHTKIAF